jgi:hypothetical protein
MKIRKKTWIVDVVMQSKYPQGLPDWGLGKGVLKSVEISFKDNGGQGFDCPLFAVAMNKAEDALIHETVKVRWTEKKSRIRRKKR